MLSTVCAATDIQRQLVAVSGLDSAVVVVAAVVAAGIWAFAVRALDRRLPLSVRVSLALLRGLIVAACLVLMVQPTLHIRTVKEQPASVAVLVDTSMSMRRGEHTRLDMATDLLRRSRRILERLERKVDVRLWAFSDGLYPVDAVETLAVQSPSGNRTDIRRALSELLESSGDASVQAVVLISDGGDTEMKTNAGGDWQTDWAVRFGVPIHSVLVKDAPTRTDLSIQRVDATPFAFLRSDTPVAVTLGAVGIPDREVEAFLKKDGAVLQRRTARLVGGKARLTFDIMPLELGKRVYEIAVPLPKNDEVPDNNRHLFTVDVVRDKYRILHLAGRPSWDQRFLRDTLKSWPRVDLVSFYVLRTEYQSTVEGADGMALIPFPTEELFNEHLGEFDLIIFHEFEPTEVGVDAYGGKIAEFVRNGGALAVIGGDQGLGAGTFGDNGLESLLPVVLLPPGTSPSRRSDATPFRAKLTDAGAAHPVTRIREGTDDNRRLWRGLDPLDGVGRVARLSPEAKALAVHPGLSSDDGPHPVIAVAEAEKGRVMTICTDSFWRQRFTGPMNGGAGEFLSLFWHNAVAWLTRAPELERLRIAVEPSPVVLQDTAVLETSLFDDAYRPAAGEPIQLAVSWTGADGKEMSEVFSSTMGNRGKYRMDWTPKAPGAHRVHVSAGNGLEARASFLVDSGRKEQNRMAVDESTLRALSDATGGGFEVNDLTVGDIVINPAIGNEVLSQSSLSLWDHPAVLVLLLLLAAAEWTIRRRTGLD